MRQTRSNHNTTEDDETNHANIILDGILLLTYIAIALTIAIIIGGILYNVFIGWEKGSYAFLACLTAFIICYGAGLLENRYDLTDRIEQKIL